ncbi:MAG: NF038130 family PEP-CTERM protein [Cyanobacteria bacterium P01_H01_bin.58]
MKGIVQKVVLGTSVLVGMSAFMGSSALADTLSNITSSDDNFRTYNGTTLGDISDGDLAEAISALTDDDLYTNVELGIDEGTTTSFFGEIGGTSVELSGVTMADWVGGLADQWIADFEAAYPTLAGLGSQFTQTLGATFVQRAGDPNVSSFTQEDNGQFTLTSVGHFNLLNAPWIASEPMLGAAANLASGLLGGNPLQVSEITKVILDGEVNYVYSFFATETGVVAADAGANDNSSHSGLFSSTFGEADGGSASVPEPTMILGLVAVGGLITASKRKLNKA